MSNQSKKMKKNILLFSFLLTATIAMAQIKITGSVKDNKQRALQGISITLIGTYDGATSDSIGNFKFTTYEKGNFILEAKSLGYKTVTQNITINNEALIINFNLKEEISELNAVTVTAGSFEASDKKRAATVLSALDIYTTGGANADITATAKTLPGAQQVGEEEGLFVRGGANYETKQLIDGMVVSNPFFTSSPDIASRGRFAPHLFKGTVFSTGGYSALYGQALSGVLLLESINMPERSEANASISTVFVGAGFQHLAKNKKSSIGVNYGYTNLLPYFKIVKQKPDYFTAPEFNSFEANFRIKTKKNGFIKYYTNFTNGNFGLRNTDIDSNIYKNAIDINNYNWYNNLSYNENLSKGWKLQLGFSFTTNKDKINTTVQDKNNQLITTGVSHIDNKNFNLTSWENTTIARAVLEKKITGINVIRFGTEYWNTHNKYSFYGYEMKVNDNYIAGFAETDLYLTNNIAFKIGGRVENNSIIKKTNFAPRISLAYKSGKTSQMSIAFGEFYQKPELQQILDYSGHVKQTDYTKATHFLINYIKKSSLQTFRVEAYYKKYNNLIKTFPDTNVSGSGYAQGIEIFWRDKKTFNFLDYWISYSYLDTKRDFLNYPTKMQPTFATPHTINVVTKTFVVKWKTGFNLTYNFATGRPYYNIAFNNNTQQYELKDEGKTISLHNLGFSVNYLPKLGNKKAKTFIVWVASVTNVLNSQQIFGYRYSYNGLNKVAVTPPAKQFIFLGCFLSWGVDRTQDAINNNL